MNKNTYVFDLDGTLLDTLDDLTASTNYALRQMQMAERSKEEVRRFVGNGIAKLIERAVPEGTDAPTTARTLELFRQYYLLHDLDHTRPYPGIVEMLRELKAQDKQIAIVSNKYYEATERLAEHFFPDLIDVAIGEHEAAGIKKKPAPDTVVLAMSRLHATKEEAVYIGDSDVDIATAAASGLPCISVLWGFRDQAFLEAHGATRFATAPSDIPLMAL